MADGGDDLTNCPVCFDEYTETGDYIPRILPCFHTLCEKCLGQLVQNDRLDCPECRVKLTAPNGKTSFPQNKYVLAHLKKQASKNSQAERRDGGKSERCEEHDRRKSLFCRETECKKSVCPVCLVKHHGKHQYVDLEVQEAKRDSLLSDLEVLKDDLQNKREKFEAAKAEVERNNESCIAAIKETKEKIIKSLNDEFDKTIKEASEADLRMKEKLDQSLSIFDDSIVMIDNIKENTAISTVTDEDFNNHETTLATTTTKVDHLFHTVIAKKMKYTPLEDTSLSLKALSGQLEVPVETYNISTNLNFTVVQTIRTDLDFINDICAVGDDSFALCGGRRLLKYSAQDLSKTPTEVSLDFAAYALNEITVEKENLLAVSFTFDHKLQFHETKDLSVIQRCSVAPYKPDGLTTPSGGVLFYADLSVTPTKIRRLEWTPGHLRLSTGSIINLPQAKFAHNICFAQHAGEQLVVVTCGVPTASHGGIFGYDAKNIKVKWQVEGKLSGMTKSIKAQGITTDDQGHLFVSDNHNKCIQMFDFNGNYLGGVLKKGDHGLRTPRALTWCKACLPSGRSWRGTSVYQCNQSANREFLICDWSTGEDPRLNGTKSEPVSSW